MKINNLLAIAVSSLMLTACFDSGAEPESVANEKSAPFAETDVITEATVTETGELQQEVNPDIQKVSYSQNALNRVDNFIQSEESSELPTTKPDAKGVSHKPLSNSGAVKLKPSKYAPLESSDYTDEERKVECSKEPDNYYCSDEFMLKVQKSKNRIEISGGGSVVLAGKASPREGSTQGSGKAVYSLVYVKDNTVYPTAWYYADFFGDNDAHDLKYARVNGDACIYGQLYTVDQPDDFNYVCFKESPDGLEFPDTEAIVFSSQTYDKPFTTFEVSKLSETSYGSFYDLAF